VHELIADHRVHALRWDLVFSHLGICALSILIIRLETTMVFQNCIAIWLLVIYSAIIISLERLLARLEYGVWLITIPG